MSNTKPLFDPTIETLDKIYDDLSLIQQKNGLKFGTDSYLLAAFTHPHPSGVAVELGGGTGVVSLLAAARSKFSVIHCAEIQKSFAELIKRNAELNGLSEHVIPHHTDVRLLTPADFGKEVNAVFSNPPYMRSTDGRENATPELTIARREENGTIADFTSTAATLLRHGGYFTVVYRPDRMAELLSSMTEAHLEPKRLILIYPTATDKPCLILVEGKKGAAPGLRVSRPLIIYSDKSRGIYTADMQKVYDDFSLDFLFD